jgi:hypothetical protein
LQLENEPKPRLYLGKPRTCQTVRCWEFEENSRAATLKEKLIKIGAKVVRHGRYVAFQMAEVAIPRNLFDDILG